MDDFIDVSETKTNTGYNFSLIERYATDLTKKTYYTDPSIARDKELKEMRDSLAVGDTIVTIGGIVANVAKIEEETIVIEFGPSRTKMPIQKWAIGSVQSKKEIK